MPKPVNGSTANMYQVPGETTIRNSSNLSSWRPQLAPAYQGTNAKKTSSASAGSSGSANRGSGYTASSVQAATSAQTAVNPYAELQASILAQMQAAQEAQRRAREEAYQKAAAQQKANYDYAAGQVNDATAQALQEAYVNRMLQQKNLKQALTAQGLTGGASETTTASMLNNYQNSRNDLELENKRQLGDLLNTYQNNMAQLEQQRASGEAASLSDYATALVNLAANNGVNLVSLLQGNAVPTASGNARYVNGEWVYY